jgi:monofunctional biosynthetic peptidoglycan transglycosylase
VAKRRKGRLARALRVVLFALAAWAAVTVVAVVAMRWIDPPTSAFMLRDRIGGLFDESHRFRHEWRDWDEISKYAAVAVIAAEDQQFPFHGGFDFKQIDKALADRERGRRVRGASTISQQVAKNLFLWPGQSWFRKGLEAGITVLIEAAWPKRRILEVYLNVAEFGRGTWGVQAASRRFFRKDASRLTAPEAALLAAVLPSPRRYRVDAPGPYVRKRQAWIQRQMTALGGTAYLRNLD